MEKYWFVVNPDVFIWKKGDKVLVYNALNYTFLEFNPSNRFNELYELLNNPDHLYVVEVTENDLEDENLNFIVKSIVETECGKLLLQKDMTEAPVSFFPMIGIQRSRDKLKDRMDMQSIENYLIYLQELTIYINGGGLCDNLCAKQFPYLLDSGNEQDFNRLNFFLKCVGNSSVAKIRISGNNVFKYGNFIKLFSSLDRIHAIKSIYVSCQQLIDFYKEHKLYLSEQFEYVIIVDKKYPFDEKVLLLINEYNLPIKYFFYVTSEEESLIAQSLIDKHHLQSYGIRPIFSGDNQKFFSDYVYLSEEDIKNSFLNKREVFANQVLNTNDFGKFIISPEGSVFVNTNFSACGSLDDSIHSLIKHELLYGDLWFRTRMESPCSECLYQWLCPSPSNYELVMNKSNLCFKG